MTTSIGSLDSYEQKLQTNHEENRNNLILQWLLGNKKMDKQILEKIMPRVKFDLEPEVFTSLKKVSFHHFLATGSLENNPLIDITWSPLLPGIA